MTDSNPVTVGIAGLGRSGWGIHANALQDLPEQFRVVAVCDPEPARQSDAIERFRCSAYGEYAELVANPEVELMVVATPSHLHAADVSAALRAGKHVIVEKPMASDLAGVDEMIAVANATGRILTVSQNRRLSADFVKVQEVITSGVLGRILEVRIRIGHFARRWDWQTLKRFGGGELNNSGAHYIDMGLLLIDDPEPTVFCHMETTPLYAGDAENQVRVLLRPKSGPLVDVSITNADAYPEPMWKILGTQGTLVCDATEARWTYFDPDEVPPLVLDTAPTEGRSYNREQLPMSKETATLSQDFGGNVKDLYRSLFASIREGAPLAVTAESVRRQVAVLEKCRELSPV